MNYARFTWMGILVACLVASCSGGSDVAGGHTGPGGDENTDGGEEQVSGPEYADDYTPISSWAQRAEWNLANVHDPSVVKDGDYFYMYQTNASYGNVHRGHGYYPYRRSRDLVDWEYAGSAFSEVPSWVKDSLNTMRAGMEPSLPPIEEPEYGFWAPHITKVGTTYRLYYSVVVSNPIVGNVGTSSWTERAFIGLAESADLSSNNWEDKGMVIHSVADGRESYERDGGNDWSGYFKYNAIDPSVVVTPEGAHWLIYGSWHSGIAAVELNPETGKPDKLENLDDYGTRIAGRGNVQTNRWQALEAPEIIYNEDTGYYYLFISYDELSVAYNTHVARSQQVTGPYYDMNGNNVTEGAEAWPMITHPYAFDGHTGWVGFSHCSVFRDPDTATWFYSSQARLPQDVPGIQASNAVMMGHVREMYWTDDGWPVVAPQRYAGIPDSEIQRDHITGHWEQITLEYQYQVMQTSESVVFNEDNTLGGAVEGTWSFDQSSNTLIINGTKHIIDTAWDWEASPRVTTITYAGLSPNGRSIWSKKTGE